MKLVSIKEIKNIKDKKIFLRVDFNISQKDTFRIKETLPTIKFLLKKGGYLFLVSHFNDPPKIDFQFSLKNILPLLKKILPPIDFWPYNKTKEFLFNQKNFPLQEKIILLENIRFFGDKNLNKNIAKKWAKNFDIYVNEAFSVSHRKHISTYLLSLFLPSYFGFQFEKEIKNLAVWRQKKPIVLILGGAKISTKYDLIKNFQKSKLVKKIILGGGLLNYFLKQNGFDIKNSFYEKNFNRKISRKKILATFNVFFKNNQIVDLNKNGLNEIFKFLDEFEKKTRGRGIVIWNGPLGIIEKKESTYGTKALAQYLIRKKLYKIVGGGDTLAFLNKLKLTSKFNYFSTGGGAMLWFLAHRSLPILELDK